jgi:PadR family transcriptional regulator
MAYMVMRLSREISIHMALALCRQRGMARHARSAGSRGHRHRPGLPAAFAVTRLASSHLYGVSANDPLAMASATLLLAAEALLAGYIPAEGPQVSIPSVSEGTSRRRLQPVPRAKGASLFCILCYRFLYKKSILDIDSMPKADNLQGALELLVMKILRRGPNHGFAITTYIQETSDEILRLEAGSLYPALHRMTEAGLLKAEWRISEAGRRARFYELTAKGRKQLETEEKRWRAVTAAVAKVLRTA